jgi:cobalamin biosynthesis Mg chelatase CobN
VAPNALIEKLDEIKDFLAHSHPRMTLASLIEVMANEYHDRHSPALRAERQAERAQARTKKSAQEKAERDQTENSSKAPEHASKESKNTQAPSAQKTGEFVGSLSATTVIVSPDSGVGSEDQKRTLSQTMLHELINIRGYQCSYVDPVTKQQCVSKRGLEIHHIRPYSHGGPTNIANCALTCIQHHQRLSFLQFGDRSKYFKQRE